MGYQQSLSPGRKQTRYGFLRDMRTTQERRAWDEEYGRAARSAHRLVDAWDDVCRHFERSWKRHRRTQYKPVDMTA